MSILVLTFHNGFPPPAAPAVPALEKLRTLVFPSPYTFLPTLVTLDADGLLVKDESSLDSAGLVVRPPRAVLLVLCGPPAAPNDSGLAIRPDPNPICPGAGLGVLVLRELLGRFHPLSSADLGFVCVVGVRRPPRAATRTSSS
ncbi:hypothetical protein BC937DRAFT_92536 [Endogone sp. FLAS-F59071]|nr:hypothetical protein BC937DRAFT_92536 [Endogone sp. FLAS-F59071]|eukprot:RUS15377.1 hypothetical protein BC937DRAFT_92536 [Endogone sp. FLAS-F59071]